MVLFLIFFFIFSDCRCHVYDGTPLREFVHFLRGHIHSKKPIFVFFKNTKPPNSELQLILASSIIFCSWSCNCK